MTYCRAAPRHRLRLSLCQYHRANSLAGSESESPWHSGHRRAAGRGPRAAGRDRRRDPGLPALLPQPLRLERDRATVSLTVRLPPLAVTVRVAAGLLRPGEAFSAMRH